LNDDLSLNRTQDIDGRLAINDLCYECLSWVVRSNRNIELFSLLDCRKHLASAARLATERRACIPGRRVFLSVQHGNAAMPNPPATGDLLSALAP
jgi:hypothetical protein